MTYHKNFVSMYTALIKIYVFWRPVLFLFLAKIKGHLPNCSLDKAVTYMNMEQNCHHYLQTDTEQLTYLKKATR